MTRFRVNDIMWELAEFARDLLSETRQLLQYHRASAYKDETSKKINLNLAQTRALFEILSDEILLDLLADIDALESWAGQAAQTGECSLSARANHLIKEAIPVLDQYQKKVARDRGVLREDTLRIIAERRRALLSVCRQGTRSWALLKSL